MITRPFVPIVTCVVTGSVFAAGLLTSLLPVRYLLAALLVIGSALLLLQRPRTRCVHVFLAVLLGWAVVGAVYCILLTGLSPADNDALFRYAVLAPVAVVFGYLLAGSAFRPWLARSVVGWALLCGVIAFIEFVSGRYLVERADMGDLERVGFIRAIVLAEHPLVLSALLVAALPFIWSWNRAWYLKVALSVPILAGIVATGSRGALALVALFAVVSFVVWRWTPSRPGRPALRMLVALVVVGAVLVIGFLSGVTDAVFLTSHSPEEASIQYRLVLYQKILSSLLTHPWGWGIGGLPPDVFLVTSPFGVHDLSVTVDSEVALLAFDAGIVGVAAFAILVGWLFSRRVLTSPNAVSLLLLTFAGFYLAIHAWTGLLLLFALILGAAASDSRKPDRATD